VPGSRWQDAAMSEYGRIVGESSKVGGGGGGSHDLASQVLATLSDAVDQVLAVPPEILLAVVAVIIVGWILLKR
jgi:hypothetical protein